MTPEEGAFYYDASHNTLAYCPTDSIFFGRVYLDKVNVEDADDKDASCPLEYFQAHYKKVAFLVNEESA